MTQGESWTTLHSLRKEDSHKRWLKRKRVRFGPIEKFKQRVFLQPPPSLVRKQSYILRLRWI
jgi:hypothetical protein